MSLIGDLSTAHRNRLKRIAKAAWKPPAPPSLPITPLPEPVSPELIDLQRLLAILARSPQAKTGLHPVTRIQRIVASYYGLSVDELLAKRRSLRIVRPRQRAFYLCRQLTRLSLPEIGRRFGQDHTTGIHACSKTERCIAEDPKVAADIEELKRLIEEGA